MARKTTTSTEVKSRWNAKTYQRYTMSLRYDRDQDLIHYLEAQTAAGVGVTDVLRQALSSHIEKTKRDP